MDSKEIFQVKKTSFCVPEKEIDEVPRKVTLSEYLSSPEFQRKRKIERRTRSDRRLLRKRWLSVSSGTESDQRQAETETRSEGA